MAGRWHDHRVAMMTEAIYAEFMHDVRRGRVRALRPYDQEAARAVVIDRFGTASKTRREALFNRQLPYSHHARLVHPNPHEALDVARAAFMIRRIGWWGAKWQAIVRGLDLSTTLHERYLMSLYVYDWQNDACAWAMDEPFTVPDGIPLTEPSADERRDWHPDTTLYDIEDAALLEVEIGVGGPASALLHSRMTNGVAPRNAVMDRVAAYMDFYRALKKPTDLPSDPYDALNWGHDSRAKNIRLTQPGGAEINYTPAFDPEVLEYDVDRDLEGCTFEVELFDPLLDSQSTAELLKAQSIVDTRGANSLILTVSSKAKDSTTHYSFTEGPPENNV